MALPEPTLYRIFNRPGRPVCLAELAGAKTMTERSDSDADAGSHLLYGEWYCQWPDCPELPLPWLR